MPSPPAAASPSAPPRHRVADELCEVVSWFQLNRFDPACACFVGEVVAHGLAAARPRIPHDDRTSRRDGGLERRVYAEHRLGERYAEDQERNGHKTEAKAVIRQHNHDDGRQEQQRAAGCENTPCGTPPQKRLPCQNDARREQRDRHQAVGEVAQDLDHGRDDCSHQAHQCRRSGNTPTDHRVVTFRRQGPRV